jgi:hypothetical protein
MIVDENSRWNGVDIRADAQGKLYKFDEAHTSSKVHLECIEEKSGKFWNIGEVDPETGVGRWIKRRLYK